MAQRTFPVLVATDGSAAARAAVEAATAFPWPAHSTGHGVIARGTPVLTEATPMVWDALLEAARIEAGRAQARLRRRWPAAQVVVSDSTPVHGILAEARGRKARAIVLGSRGLGTMGRLFLGSVSRAVVRQARSSVLVVRAGARAPRRFLVAVDGSAHARRAVGLVCELPPPKGGQVRLVSVVEPVRVHSTALLPAKVRAVVSSEAAALEKERQTAAQRACRAAQARLTRAGWRVEIEIRIGSPLEEILDAVQGADTLVVGARGVSGVERLLLGSVAEGVVTRAPIPVLVVR